MKKRLANWVIDHRSPLWMKRRAFDYLLEHGRPAYSVTFGPSTWTTASATTMNITFPLSPENPYR